MTRPRLVTVPVPGRPGAYMAQRTGPNWHAWLCVLAPVAVALWMRGCP